ncbi:MAG: hypothetical protein M1823_002136 [Watsoniomyces obsoletus]|nr:MAG: hypothetical protein M1823_002136 [Watsoniomyces obsoletus]
MGFDLTLPLRGLQALFAIIVLGLTGYVSSEIDRIVYWASTPSQVSFLIFLSIWTVIAVAVLIALPRFMPRAAHPFALLAIEAVTMIFWFAGFIAVAVFVSDIIFCLRNVCGCLKAAAAFGAFEWALWTATTILTGLRLRSGATATKPVAGTGPTVTV